MYNKSFPVLKSLGSYFCLMFSREILACPDTQVVQALKVQLEILVYLDFQAVQVQKENQAFLDSQVTINRFFLISSLSNIGRKSQTQWVTRGDSSFSESLAVCCF